MSFTDTSMAGHYSTEDLAAIAIGTSIWMPVYLLIRGTLIATTLMVARLYGAGKSQQIGSLVRQANWIAVALGLIGFIFLQHTEWILILLEISPLLIEKTTDYLVALSWGVPAICMYEVLVCYCEGCSKTKPSMIISLLALLVNIPLNYLLIYGNFGFPELGGVGCGYATSICFCLMFMLMLAFVSFSNYHKKSDIFTKLEMPDAKAIIILIKLGIPIGLAFFFEAGIFCAIALVIGKLGTTIVAGHQIALNFSSITFMVPLSLSMGLTVRTSQAIGAGNPEKAAFIGYSGILTALFGACISATAILIFSEQIASFYTVNPAVRALAVELLFFAALFQFFDAIQIASIGALRGYKDTRIPMIMILVACWVIALPFGYLLGLTDVITESMGPHGLWIGLLTAMLVAAPQLAVRFRIVSRREIEKTKIAV